ncbi:MAG: hypothetical protein PHU85_13320 [Phycisphaerae bacterium]|nr:hypothetical protein [Phycisphaerae bacterium]
MIDPIEDAVRQLAQSLRQPTPSLDRRVLSRGARPRLIAAAMAGMALAAGLAIVAGWWMHHAGQIRPSSPAPIMATGAGLPAVDARHPVRTERSWTGVVYAGSVDRAEGPPLRAYRVRTLRNVQWQDPASGTTVTSTVPQERVVLLAADVH